MKTDRIADIGLGVVACIAILVGTAPIAAAAEASQPMQSATDEATQPSATDERIQTSPPAEPMEPSPPAEPNGPSVPPVPPAGEPASLPRPDEPAGTAAPHPAPPAAPRERDWAASYAALGTVGEELWSAAAAVVSRRMRLSRDSDVGLVLRRWSEQARQLREPAAEACARGVGEACAVTRLAQGITVMQDRGEAATLDLLVEGCEQNEASACEAARWLLAAQLLSKTKRSSARRPIARLCLAGDPPACEVLAADPTEAEALFLVARCERDPRACAVAVDNGLDDYAGNNLRMAGGIAALLGFASCATGAVLIAAAYADRDNLEVAFSLAYAGTYAAAIGAVPFVGGAIAWGVGMARRSRVRSRAEEYVESVRAGTRAGRVRFGLRWMGPPGSPRAGPGLGLTLTF